MGWTWKAKKKLEERQETVHIVEHPQYIMHMKDVETHVASALCERIEPTQTHKKTRI